MVRCSSRAVVNGRNGKKIFEYEKADMIKYKDIVIVVDVTIYISRNGKTALTMEKSQNTVITTDTRP